MPHFLFCHIVRGLDPHPSAVSGSSTAPPLSNFQTLEELWVLWAKLEVDPGAWGWVEVAQAARSQSQYTGAALDPSPSTWKQPQDLIPVCRGS